MLPDRVLSRRVDYGRFLATPEKRNNSGIDQISTSAGKQPCHGHFTAMPKFCRSSAILGVFSGNWEVLDGSLIQSLFEQGDFFWT